MRSRRASRRHCILCFVAVLLTGSLAGEAARARPPSRTGVRANDPASSADSTSSEASPSNKFVSWAEGEHFTGEWGACETGWPTGDRHRILLRSRLVGPAGWRHKGSGYRPQSFRRQCQLRSRAAVQALGRHGVHRCLWALGSQRIGRCRGFSGLQQHRCRSRFFSGERILVKAASFRRQATHQSGQGRRQQRVCLRGQCRRLHQFVRRLQPDDLLAPQLSGTGAGRECVRVSDRLVLSSPDYS